MDQIHGPDPRSRSLDPDPLTGSIGWIRAAVPRPEPDPWIRLMSQNHGSGPWTRTIGQIWPFQVMPDKWIRTVDPRARRRPAEFLGRVPWVTTIEQMHVPNPWIKNVDKIHGRYSWIRYKRIIHQPDPWTSSLIHGLRPRIWSMNPVRHLLVWDDDVTAQVACNTLFVGFSCVTSY